VGSNLDPARLQWIEVVNRPDDRTGTTNLARP
jgi:hypothetical protein